MWCDWTCPAAEATAKQKMPKSFGDRASAGGAASAGGTSSAGSEAAWEEHCPFWQVWAASVEKYPDRPFLRFEISEHEHAEWSYSEFDGLVGKVAGSLAKLGVGRGGSVHLALANSPLFVAVWLATSRLGGWIVPSDPHGRAPELADHISRTNPAVGICASDRAAVYREAVDAAGKQFLSAAVAQSSSTENTARNNTARKSISRLFQPPEVLALEESPAGISALADIAAGSVSPANSSVISNNSGNSISVSSNSISPDLGDTTELGNPSSLDLAAVAFTSGTTGRPKGVEITQANYAFTGKVMAEAADLHAEHRWLVVLPLFHANAQYYSFASAIWAGASVALMPAFSASRFLAQAKQHQATHASLFAAPMRMILARGAEPVAGLRLEHCWFAQNVTSQQHAQLGELLGCAPRQLYGMTETIPAVLSDRLDELADPLSMGRVTPGCAVQVQDEDGSETADGEVGEVAVSGEPGISLFRGYMDDPETTSASFRNGWFLTGDRARRDQHGRHYFAGRHSEILKVAGENVSVVEIEQHLAEHPDVLEAAVVGCPDAMRDEVPVGYVVAADPSAPPSEESLRRWCEERLSKPKRPQSFTLLDELPRTSVGKIRKFLLAEQAADSAK